MCYNCLKYECDEVIKLSCGKPYQGRQPRAGPGLRRPSRVDLHVHSNVSDGQFCPMELARMAGRRGLKYFSLTDHDAADGLEDVIAALPEGVGFIRGTEITAEEYGIECHILGYGCDFARPRIREVLASGQAGRREKFEIRIKELMERQGFDLNVKLIEDIRKVPSIGKPHVAKLLTDWGSLLPPPELIELYLNPIETDVPKIQAREAIAAILDAGGIPVLAHPVSGGAKGRTDDLVHNLAQYGLMGLECWYGQYPEDICRGLEFMARRHNLLVSGGSDYHNPGLSGRNMPGWLNRRGRPVDARRLTLIQALKRRNKIIYSDRRNLL